MACSNWVDEDQPLRYRMGKVDIAGNKFPFDATLDTLKGMKLESGTITLYAEVLDSLDAVSEKVTDEVTISPATFRRRLLANSALDSILLEIKGPSRPGQFEGDGRLGRNGGQVQRHWQLFFLSR